MSIDQFIAKIKTHQAISFDETLAIITRYYAYQPSEFSNGLGEDILISPAGTNQGSCKIFAFAQLQALNQQQTLHLFGNYYQDVLNTPNGTDHQNIRQFIKYGWNGIQFKNFPLNLLKNPDDQNG